MTEQPAAITGVHLGAGQHHPHEALLRGIADAGIYLLLNDDLPAAIVRALSAVGMAVAVDRVYVFEKHTDHTDGTALMSQRFEWTNGKVSVQIDNPSLQNVAYAHAAPRWFSLLSSGSAVSGLVRDLPNLERAALELQEILSILVVPITIERRFWGFVGFDDCHTPRIWRDIEIDALTVLANMIGSVIVKDRMRVQIKQSEANFSAFFNASVDLLSVLDQEGRVLKVNMTLLSTLGYREEDLIGRGVHEIHPASRYDEVCSVMHEMQLGSRSVCTIPLSTRDGQEVAVETRVVKGTWNGEPAVLGISRDITDLMRSEERHRTLIEETPLGIAVFREEGDCVLLNDAICRILTSRRESILGKNFHTLSSWTDCGLLEAAEEALSRWTQVSLNTTTTVMSGKTLHISCILSPYRVRNEKFLMVIVEDRTVQKNAEIALGHARAWKDALLENSPVGIAVLDNERRIQDLNPTTAAIFGYCYEEAIGREVSFLHLSPDHAKRFGESVYPAIRRGEPVRREWQLQRKDGEVFWADLSGKAINPLDLDQGVIWIIIDISARKGAEELLRQAAAWREALLTNSPVGIFVVDHERKIIDINPAAFEIFGFDNNELLGSSSRALYYSDEMWESFGSQVYPYRARGETKRLEFQFKRKDGEPCWCDATGRALQPGNLNAGVIWIVQDISERKKVERELERYRRDLVLANEELDNKVKARTREIERLLAQKDRFIIQLGHDLRTPLTPILALLPLLKRDLSDPRQVELVEVILGSARQLKELMERLLTLAKLNSGAFRYILKDVEIRDEVLRTIGLHLHQIQEKDLVVTQSIETNMMTKADQEFFHSIIENLISNAIKYTPFSGEIGVTVTRMGDQVEIVVSDTGIGMTQEEIAQVFDEFYMGDPARSKGESFGLGLTIVRRIVEVAGGSVTAESPGKGQGTVFRVVLPVVWPERGAG